MRIDVTHLSFLTSTLQKSAQKRSVLPDAVKTDVLGKMDEKKVEDKQKLEIRIHALTDEQQLELTKKAEFSALAMAWSRHKTAYEGAVKTRDDFVTAKESKAGALAALAKDPNDAAAAGRLGVAQQKLDTLVRNQTDKTTNETARALSALTHRVDMLGTTEFASEDFMGKYSSLLFADPNDSAEYFTATEDTFLGQIESSVAALDGRVKAVEQAFIDVGKKYGLNRDELLGTISKYKNFGQSPATLIQALELEARGQSKSIFLEDNQREELKMQLAQSGMSEQKIAAILRGDSVLAVYI